MSTQTTAEARNGHSVQPQPLAGLGTLMRLIIRRDRVRGPAWVVGIVLLVLVGAASTIGLYNTPEQLQNYADLTSGQAAIKAILGPGYGLENPTQGAVVMDEMALITFVVIALMSVFLMVRHTRADEESGRAELLRAAPVGRLAMLVAASIWLTVLNVLVAVGNVVSMVALGLPTEGSLAFGVAGLGVGVVFMGVAAVAAQLASGGRAATAIAGAALGISYLVRAVGDVGWGWLSWLSPLGWSIGIRAYADERWWVVLPLLALALAMGAFAVTLSARRDFDAGILPQRPGPARASALLSTPLGLVFRLQRASLIGWTVGIATMGLVMGFIADEAQTLAENDSVAELLTPAATGSLTDAYLATMAVMLALAAGGFAVSAALRLRSEESAVRADPVLAGPVSRVRWAAGYVIVAVGGSAVILVVTGLLTGLGAAVSLNDIGEVLPVTGAFLAQLPAVFVLIGVTVALMGWLPQWSAVAWAALAFVVIVGLLGDLLQIPQWVRGISPFDHIPLLPAEPMQWLPIVALTAIGAILAGIGLFGMRRRDIG